MANPANYTPSHLGRGQADIDDYHLVSERIRSEILLMQKSSEKRQMTQSLQLGGSNTIVDYFHHNRFQLPQNNLYSPSDAEFRMHQLMMSLNERQTTLDLAEEVGVVEEAAVRHMDYHTSRYRKCTSPYMLSHTVQNHSGMA